MKKSLIYYLSQIKEAYPEITDIKKQDYEKISAEINAQIQAGGPVTAHKKLYSKTYRFLKRLAVFYADNGLNFKSFNDNLSTIQLTLMDRINSKVNKNEWFSNFKSYVQNMFSSVYRFFNKIENIVAEQSQFAETKENKNSILVQDLLNDKAMQEVYEHELQGVEINELKAILNDVLNTLTPHEKEIVLEYYGLNGDKGRSLAKIGSSKDLSEWRVGQILAKALRKLRHPFRAKKLYDFYKYDSD